jgi:hypothetical protein
MFRSCDFLLPENDPRATTTKWFKREYFELIEFPPQSACDYINSALERYRQETGDQRVWLCKPLDAAKKCFRPVGVDDFYTTCPLGTVRGNVLTDIIPPWTPQNDQQKSCKVTGARLISPPKCGVLDFRSDGTFVYTPNACCVDDTDSFKYRSLNGPYESCDVTVLIKIMPCAVPFGAQYDIPQCGPHPTVTRAAQSRGEICPTCPTCVPPSCGGGVGDCSGGGGGVGGGGPGGGGGIIPIVTGVPCRASPSPGPHQQIRASSHWAAARLDGSGGLEAPNDGVCARVKLRIDQDAVIARDYFKATLELSNSGTSRLENIGIEVRIRSEGTSADNVFDVRLETTSAGFAVDGTGVLTSGRTGTARWKLTPTIDAAPMAPRQFRVGGILRYRLDGVNVSVPFNDVPITVLPTPRLRLTYFHQRDVFSDDPDTLQIIEPAIPYSLAVMIQNVGFGMARNMRITSAQPIIVENLLQVLIDFQIIATRVAGEPLQPSLTANFGNIGPGQITIGEWLMTSSLQGLFTDYRATFEHIDGRGNPRLSLIESVAIKEMIHQVQALGALDDGKPDFLVNEVEDLEDLPDTLYLSDGSTSPVTVIRDWEQTGAPGPGQFNVDITAAMGSGWTYLLIPDPASGRAPPLHYDLLRVVRSDGVVIPLDGNAWVTDRTFPGLKQPAIRENMFHLLDHGGPGTYTLTYGPRRGPDTTAPASNVLRLAAQSPLEFPVSWIGSDGENVPPAFYDIYVSTNGGPYTLWLGRSQATGALYSGTFGHTYSFYSRATDAAGNQEPAPVTADATTQVSLSNIAPVLTAITDQQIPEGETLTLDLTASDPDGPSGSLRFAFAAAVPPGLTINAQTGRISWVTGEADGARNVPVTAKVTDGGVPPLSDSKSFNVTVLEDNKAPVLNGVPPQSVRVGETLAVQLHAQDADLPVQTLAYRFTTSPPAGMTLNAGTGLISWTPTESQANLTAAVSVAATDSGSPPMEAATIFAVTVEPLFPDRPPQFNLTAVQLWIAGALHTLAVNAFDPDGDAVTLTLNPAGLPGNVSFASTAGTGTGTITWDTSGVAPGTYSLPVQASANSVSTLYAPQVKIVADNLYWRWAFVQGFGDAQDADPLADPDGDRTPNIFEWAHFRDPLVPDGTLMTHSLEGLHERGWMTMNLDLYRRRGSDEFVTMLPQWSTDLASWANIPASRWEAFVDPFGDTDENPDSEEHLFRIFLYPLDPGALFQQPREKFFRLESTLKLPLP